MQGGCKAGARRATSACSVLSGEQGCVGLLRTTQGVTERSTDAKADSMNLQQVECHHECMCLHLLTSVRGHIPESFQYVANAAGPLL